MSDSPATAQKQDAAKASLDQILAHLFTTLSVAAASLPLPAGAATEATLSAVLTRLQAQRAETLWTDDTGGYFVRVDNAGTITWLDVSGNAASAPGVGARPAAGATVLLDKSSYQATAAATGYSVGDLIDHFVTTDPSSGAVVGHFWLNLTTEAKLASAPAAGNVAPVATAAIPAGENHLGSFGSDSAHPSCTPVTTALTYASGKCIGGLNTLAGFLRSAGKSSLIQSATLRSKGTLTGAVDLVIFRDTPTITAGLVDNATFAVDATEVGKVSKVISFTSWNSLGLPSIATLDGIGKYLTIAAGVDAKCILVARAAITLTTASDLTAALGLVQD